MQLVLEISRDVHAQLAAFLEPTDLTRLELASLPEAIRKARRRQFKWAPDELRRLNTLARDQGIRARHVYAERKLQEFEAARTAEIERLQQTLAKSTIQGVATRALLLGLQVLDKEQQ